MFFRQLPTGGDRNYGYVIADESTNHCAVIDPSPDPTAVLDLVRRKGFRVEYIIATHDHADHTAGMARIRSECGGQTVFYHGAGRGDLGVDDGDTLPLGTLPLTILYTPGHTRDAMCIRAGDHLVTGDTLFVGKVGGTGGRDAARLEFQSLQRLMELPEAVSVWPGHNYGIAPSSTIGHERETNPFCLRLNDFDEFCWLKDNWAAYKREHGIA